MLLHMIGVIKSAGVSDQVAGLVEGAKSVAGKASEGASNIIGDIGQGLAGASNTQKVGLGAGGGAALGALATLFQKNPSIAKALRNAALGAGVGGLGVVGANALGNLKEEVEVDGFSTGGVRKEASFVMSAKLAPPKPKVSTLGLIAS